MTALARLAALVRSESGIALAEERHSFLADALKRAHPETDAASFLELAADPRDGAGAMTRLIDEVTINETYFFRERAPLDEISWHGLLESARARGSSRVRVWSAACASGEEAYTLAILALEAFAPGPPPVEILATDIATDVLAQAWEGRYRDRAVRPVDPAIRARYFVNDGDKVAVGDLPRRLIQFERHNLIRDAMPPLGVEPFDLVVCRNVLIYFDAETVGTVLDGLAQSVQPGGSLILGSADALCATARRLALLEAPTPTVPDKAAPGHAAVIPFRRPLGRPAANRDSDDEADAAYVRGLAELESGDPAAAIASLRRAVYLDASFGLAAFALGRAHDAAGDVTAARRAYGQALRTLPEDGQADRLVGQVDVADVALACRARLAALDHELL
jgi:chemotaxis protein methyltransferase CheR